MRRLVKRMLVLFPVLGAAFAVAAAVAVAAPAPKATGDYGYSYGGVQRHLTFNAIQSMTDTCGTFWNVTGVSQFTFRLTNDTTDYTHHIALTQNGQTVGGSGGYPLTGGDQYHWNVTSGTIVGNALNLTALYDVGAPGTVMHITGTIASDGSISGTWDDNYGGARTGTFKATSGSATASVAYCGKGNAFYIDAAGNWYFMNVKAVSASGNTAWYAAQIIASSSNLAYENQPTNYLFVKVTDNGEPGIGKDVTSGDLMTPTDALAAVATHATPSASATINQGNIQVH